jgi:DNA-binding LacI/PurR family transcriptional regulator
MASATIRDVAKFANVSIATVSRVINDSGPVSEETRRVVEAAIEVLDYTPHPIAQQLSSGSTATIAVILPLLTQPSTTERLRGVQQGLTGSKFELVLYSVESPRQKQDYFSKLAHKSRIDGIISITLPPSDPLAEQLVNQGIPTVIIDAGHPKLSSVSIDNLKGGRMATGYLIELGHKKIALITDFIDNRFGFKTMIDRLEGYQQALEQAGLPFVSGYHRQTALDQEEAKLEAIELLKGDVRPTAIFAASDTQAIGVLEAAKEVGIGVPDELSVIGFDDIRDAQYTGLTTIRQQLFESGMRGANRLLEMIASGDDRPRQENLELELVRRETTAPPPA